MGRSLKERIISSLKIFNSTILFIMIMEEYFWDDNYKWMISLSIASSISVGYFIGRSIANAVIDNDFMDSISVIIYTILEVIVCAFIVQIFIFTGLLGYELRDCELISSVIMGFFIGSLIGCFIAEVIAELI